MTTEQGSSGILGAVENLLHNIIKTGLKEKRKWKMALISSFSLEIMGCYLQSRLQSADSKSFPYDCRMFPVLSEVNVVGEHMGQGESSTLRKMLPLIPTHDKT